MSASKFPSKPSRQPAPTSSPGDAEEDFASLFEATQPKATQAKVTRIAAGDLLSCTVIAVGASSVFVSVGDKSEGTIDIAEFRDPSTGEFVVAVGDVVKATIVDDGESSGSAVLSRMLGRGGHGAAELEQAMGLGIPVEGVVTGENKGGYDVQFGNIRAFCPGSQIDLRRGGARIPASDYVGKRYAFRVTKVENDGRNVVVSRRDILEEEGAAAAAKAWESIRVGAELEGTIRSLRDFGAFVDLGGVDGMIHISELSYARIGHPSEAVEVGQKVRVKVLKISDRTDRDGRRQIGLSMRALAEDPWVAAASRFPTGTMLSGTITRVEAYGAFVEITPGVEGLVHISKMVLDRRLNHARQAAEVGQAVDVSVIGIDLAERRISLSMVAAAEQVRDGEVAADRRDQDRVMAEQKDGGTLGTFADLLDEARRK